MFFCLTPAIEFFPWLEFTNSILYNHDNLMKRIFQFFVFLWLAASAFAAKTDTRLLLSASTARPGETIWVGIEFKMAPGWHIYWRNAGDSGIPTKIDWTLPAGVKAGDFQWPTPEKLISKEGGITLTTYVYNDVVVLLAPLQLSQDLKPGPLEIKANVNWQECQEICLQGHSELRANLEVGEKNVPSSDAGLLDQWRAKIPKTTPPPKIRAGWESPNATGDSRPLLIDFNLSADSKDVTADFYPYLDANYEIQSPTEQEIDLKQGKIRLHKAVTSSSGAWPTNIKGVLVLKDKNRVINAADVSLPVEKDLQKSTADFFTILQMTFFALLGGLILNIMPCVLPVISLKVLGLVTESGKDPKRLFRLGLIYGIGVLVSFAILAALSIVVQRAGGVADWGAAFRNPQFRIIITVLITLIALNLFGLFEITLGGRTMNAAGDLASKQGYPGAFFNGMLATILATPCTAPFLGAAVLFAFAQPPLITLWIFLAVGLGLAFPFVLVCWKPSLLFFFPKPGVWMEHFKVAMGFPMLITAVWLFSLTATRLGKEGVLWLGIFLVLLAFAAWMWGQFVQRSTKHRIGVLVGVALVLGFGYQYILEGKLNWRHYTTAAPAAEKINWRPWSREAVEQARKEGHPVLVDFTADSCLNCQFNKLTSLEIPATQAKLKELGAVSFIADYTDENPAIAQELARFHRAGVPLVVIFPAKPEGEPIVLPPVLTPSIVLGALEKVSGKN